MSGLGLGPREFAALLAALDQAVTDGAPPLDPARVARYLRRHAARVEDECPQTRPQNANLSRSPQWTVTQIAARLGVTTRTIRRRCAAGKFPGALRQRTGRGRGWSIPANEPERKECDHG